MYYTIVENSSSTTCIDYGHDSRLPRVVGERYTYIQNKKLSIILYIYNNNMAIALVIIDDYINSTSKLTKDTRFPSFFPATAHTLN